MRRKALVAVALLLVVASFSPVLHNGFVNYDDDVSVNANRGAEMG